MLRSASDVDGIGISLVQTSAGLGNISVTLNVLVLGSGTQIAISVAERNNT